MRFLASEAMNAPDETEKSLDDGLDDVERLESLVEALEVENDEAIRGHDEVVRGGQEQLRNLRQ